MKKRFTLLLLIAVMLACSVPEKGEQGFITKLGSDTLAVETFRKTEYGITAKVVLRSPRTVLTEYRLEQDKFRGIQSFSATRYTAESGFESEGILVHSVEKMGDSLFISSTNPNGETRKFDANYEQGVLPFIDMVHWPFELALNEAAKSESDTVVQKMLSGSRISNFVFADLGADKRTIRHPSRGVMDVIVNDKGELVTLDAAQTTRKLIVTRTEHIDIDAIATRFQALDKEGKSFGLLSGAVEEQFVVQGAEFSVSYGAPSRRGRHLFGGIVPWGERWRTGANRATHFSTTKDLMMESLKIPAGDYTLFTIPEADGGTLVINKQTGQNGRSYDETRDLGRVPMNISSKPDNTEVFTIVVEESGTGAELRLIWGETVFSVPFNIR